MFFAAKAPWDPVCEELRVLRRSMNTPVIAIEPLPVGPAKAAIALHSGRPESPRLTIALRSGVTGEVAFFASNDEIERLGSASLGLDAALSFAESMGFLFDDDEVEARGDDGPREAALLWLEHIDNAPISEAIDPSAAATEADLAAAVAAASPDSAAPMQWILDDDDEIELGDVVLEALPPAEPSGAQRDERPPEADELLLEDLVEARTAAPAGSERSRVLTKFRAAACAAAPDEEKPEDDAASEDAEGSEPDARTRLLSFW